jgi:hypothetical protein
MTEEGRTKRKPDTMLFEAMCACVAGFEDNFYWTALINIWLHVWFTLPNVQFGSTVPFTRHIRTTMLVFQE